jgi:hypothetical protein
MAAANRAITIVLDFFFAPFSHANPWVGLVLVSFVSAVVLLLVFRYTSNQQGLRRVKSRLIGHLLEVALYRDELPVVVRAQLRIVRDNLRYLAYALVPLACMILPVWVLWVQIDLRYGHRPVGVGEEAIVAVKLDPDAGSLDAVSISAPPRVKIETPALRIPAEREVDWRVTVSAPGSYELRLATAGREFTKNIVVGRPGARVSTGRVKPAVSQQFRYPGEPPLPADGPVEWVRVAYPKASLSLFRWRLHWLGPWLVLSMAFGFALRGLLRVQL